MNSLGLVEIDVEVAKRWTAASLSQGSKIFRKLEPKIPSSWSAAVVSKVGSPSPQLGEDSQGIKSAKADQVIVNSLRNLPSGEEYTLLVEDDLARRNDGNFANDYAFVGERVVRWHSFSRVDTNATRLLRSGSSGYPLNAILFTGAPSTAGLKPGNLLVKENVEKIISSTQAYITTVWDAESFLTLWNPQWAKLLDG
jgi:hypothetical protein